MFGWVQKTSLQYFKNIIKYKNHLTSRKSRLIDYAERKEMKSTITKRTKILKANKKSDITHKS